MKNLLLLSLILGLGLCIIDHEAKHTRILAEDSYVLPEELGQRFATWKATHYPNGGMSTLLADAKSEASRLKTWEANVRAIDLHNASGSSYQEGENQFTAMTDAEIVATETGLDLNDAPTDAQLEEQEKRFGAKFLPEGADVVHLADKEALSEQKEFEWNWVAQGAVNSIRNQGACGSCWAFSALGASEPAWKIAGGELLDVSEQWLVDCSPKDNGCNGGFMSNTYTYMKSANGPVLESDYKYTARNGKCAYSSKTPQAGYGTTGFTTVPANSEVEMKHAVAKQPVSIGMCASGIGSYKSGVFDNHAACSGGLNHGVVLVGYGTEGGKDFWLMRNSWGTGWGDKGYMKMRRNISTKGGMCGILKFGWYPQVKVPAGPKPAPPTPAPPKPSPPTPTPTPSGGCKTPWESVDCFKNWWLKVKAFKNKWPGDAKLSESEAGYVNHVLGNVRNRAMLAYREDAEM